MTFQKGRLLTNLLEICERLKEYKTIAVVGVSPKEDRDSYRVAKYLKEKGYVMIPVRPAQEKILEEKAYPSLQALVENKILIDIVNFFRRSDQISAHIEEAIATGAKMIWMQVGIENMEAAQAFMEAGLDVIMNRCIMVDHQNCPGL